MMGRVGWGVGVSLDKIFFKPVNEIKPWIEIFSLPGNDIFVT